MKNKKNLAIILIVIIAFLGIASFQQLAQQRPPQQDDPPTLIQLGVMSEKQKRHSKIYEEKSLALPPSLIAKGDNTIYVSVPAPLLNNANSPNKFQVLQRVSCRADAVVLGRINAKYSQLTENQSFVFTDYEIAVGDVIKNNSSLDLSKTGGFTLTAQGGSVRLNNNIFRVVVERSIPLRVGKEYIFFLKYLPDSQSFKLINEQSFFEVFTGKVRSGGKGLPNSFDDLGNFVGSLRQAASVNCSNIRMSGQVQ